MVGEFTAAGDADFAEDGLEVILDGVGADVQATGDLSGGVAGEDAPHDVLLAAGQPVSGDEDGQDGAGAGLAQ